MDKAEAIVKALGGSANILEIEPCATRLRTEVEDETLVNDAALKAAGAYGVMRAGTVIQVVVGPEADVIASDIDDIL
ncbi:PTS glucose/sucrose transporter subunit IIB [Natronoglycomyces albus]|uniref:PTS glucose/sucrose transporter subunit IIB n=1 Tax=Natronoglycomyces albus TaxID=2811108 RepID=A0A895XU75_9ACTN|nr:PTS glucose/sucrose transporter subunit IIB [Natronoglycomyces albus]